MLTGLLVALSACTSASGGATGASSEADLTEGAGTAFDRVTYRYAARFEVPPGSRYAGSGEAPKMRLELLPWVSSPMGHAEPDAEEVDVVDGVATFTGTLTVEAQDREVKLEVEYGALYDVHVFDPTSGAEAVPTKLSHRSTDPGMTGSFQLTEVSRQAVPALREIGCDRAENTESYVVRTAAFVRSKAEGFVRGDDFKLRVSYDDVERAEPIVFDSAEEHLSVVRYCRRPRASSSKVRVKVAAFEGDLLFDDDLGTLEGDLAKGQRLTDAPRVSSFEYAQGISRLWAAVE
jgi:hypothetical protein